MNFEHRFLKMGSVVEATEGALYVDFGNSLSPGVIDTHDLRLSKDSFECSTSMIVRSPGLVTDWIDGKEYADGTVRIFMHENPDFDCVASAYLIRRLLEARAAGASQPPEWDTWAPLLAESAKCIDRGTTAIRLPIKGERTTVTAYVSLLALHELASRRGLRQEAAWRWVVEQGEKVLDRSIDLSLAGGLVDLNKADLRGNLGELTELESIVDQRLEAFRSDAIRAGLISEKALDRRSPLDGLHPIVLPDQFDLALTHEAHVACITDPVSGGGFFKSLVRGSYFDVAQATCVFLTVPPDAQRASLAQVRAIISVDPESSFDLRGLGRRLDLVETEERERLGRPRVGKPRPGFDNSDPWYDGRAFAYTIVDTPRWGTLLHPSVVKRELLDWRSWHHERATDLALTAATSLRSAVVGVNGRAEALTEITAALQIWRSLGSGETPAYRKTIDVLLRSLREEDRVALDRLSHDVPGVLLSLISHPDPVLRIAILERLARSTAALSGASEELRAAMALLVTSDEESLLRQIDSMSATRLNLNAVAALLRRQVPSPRISEAVFHLLGRVQDDSLLAADAIVCCHFLASDTDSARAPQARTLSETLSLGVLERARAALSEGDLVATWPSVAAVMSTGMRFGVLQKDALSAIPVTIPAGRVIRRVMELMALQERGFAESTPIAATVPELLAQGTIVCPMSGFGKPIDNAVEMLREIDFATLPSSSRDALAYVVTMVTWRTEPAELMHLLPDSCLAHALVQPEVLASLIRIANETERAQRLVIAHLAKDPAAPVWNDVERYTIDHDDRVLLDELVDLGRAFVAVEAHKETAVTAFATRRLLFEMSVYLMALIRAGAEHLRPFVESLERTRTAFDGASEADEICATRWMLHMECRHAIPEGTLMTDLTASLARREALIRLRNLFSRWNRSAAPQIVHAFLSLALGAPEIDHESLTRIDAHSDDIRLKGGWNEMARWLARCSAHLGGETWTNDVGPEGFEALRKEFRSFRSEARRRPDTGDGALIGLAVDEVEMWLQEESHLREKLLRSLAPRNGDLDRLALDINETSTIDMLEEKSQTAEESWMFEISAALAAGARDDDRSYGARLGSVRRALLTKRPRWDRLISQLRTDADNEPTEALDHSYRRRRDYLLVRRSTLDQAYGAIIDTLVARYEVRRARNTIENYSLRRLRSIVAFWLSGAIVVVPGVLLALFISMGRTTALPAQALEWFLLGTASAAALAVVVELFARRRLTANDHHRAIDALRYRLFLPQYVLPVLVGVYTAGVSDELTSHLAMQLDDRRYFLLCIGFALAAGWALAQLIQRNGGESSVRNVLSAAGRIFSYSFVISLVLCLLLSPVVHFDVRLHERNTAWIHERGWEAQRPAANAELQHPHHTIVPALITTPHMGAAVALFPRHILLYSLFGMFIGIFLRGFWKVSEVE